MYNCDQTSFLEVERIKDDNFTVTCKIVEHRNMDRRFLYSIRNLSLDALAQYLQGRGTEDLEQDVTTVFRLTNVPKAYIDDKGKVSYVMPI